MFFAFGQIITIIVWMTSYQDLDMELRCGCSLKMKALAMLYGERRANFNSCQMKWGNLLNSPTNSRQANGFNFLPGSPVVREKWGRSFIQNAAL